MQKSITILINVSVQIFPLRTFNSLWFFMIEVEAKQKCSYITCNMVVTRKTSAC